MTREAIGSQLAADLLGPLLADIVGWTANFPPPPIAATELGHPAAIADSLFSGRPLGKREDDANLSGASVAMLATSFWTVGASSGKSG